MKQVTLMLCAVLMAFASIAACSNAVEKRGAKPGMMERVKADAVKGEVVDIGKSYISIKDDEGVTNRVRVDEVTKMDTVQKGDRVKAYVNDAGYASTLQRVEN